MADSMASAIPKSSARVKAIVKYFYALPVLLVIAMGGYLVWARFAGRQLPVHVMPATPFLKEQIAGLSANLFTQSGGLRAAGNDLFIEFRDAQGRLVNVGNVEFELYLSTTNMVMHSLGRVLPTATPGQYRTTVEPQLAGDWKATLKFSGPRGKEQTNFAVSVSR
jgi:hypothetical protein